MVTISCFGQTVGGSIIVFIGYHFIFLHELLDALQPDACIDHVHDLHACRCYVHDCVSFVCFNCWRLFSCPGASVHYVTCVCGGVAAKLLILYMVRGLARFPFIQVFYQSRLIVLFGTQWLQMQYNTEMQTEIQYNVGTQYFTDSGSALQYRDAYNTEGCIVTAHTHQRGT